jgi:arylsulfatase A-like enzyme
METVDREFHASAMDFINRAVKAKKPFFVWYNSTRMHVWTRLKKESQGRTGIGLYPDGMASTTTWWVRSSQKIDELGIADNTIVIYSTDNGAETFTWPDGGDHPLPRREGNHLRRRHARADGGPLARGDQTGHG